MEWVELVSGDGYEHNRVFQSCDIQYRLSGFPAEADKEDK